MMDLTIIDLNTKSAQFLSENSEIPSDITFKFTKDVEGHKRVTAHKLILAMVSQVFRNMFYVHNTKDRTASEISIEDRSKAAFQTMVEAIYNVKTMKESLKEKTVEIRALVDSKSAVDAVHSTTSVEDRRLKRDIAIGDFYIPLRGLDLEI